MKFDEKMIEYACKQFFEDYPTKDCDFYKVALSIEILRKIIDNEWINQVIFPNNHSVSSKAANAAIDFLKTRGIGFQFQERTCRLANRLYDIQNISGISKVIEEIKNGDICGGYAEIEAASFLYRRNIPFEFVIPSGKKRFDFDIKINGNKIVNLEVKHKIESTLPSKEVLEDTLSRANKQIPEQEPCLFFIKIPENWVNDSSISSVIERTNETFFKRNKCVLGYILHWEERNLKNEGVFHWKWRFEKNKYCNIQVNDVTEKIVNSPITLDDTLTLLMRKYINKCSNYLFNNVC